MKNTCQQLLQLLDNKLLPILPLLDDNPNKYYPMIIGICTETYQTLRAAFLNYPISSEEEIIFFKYCKPKLISKLIYFNERFKIDTNKPQASQKALKKYYKSQLKKLEAFIEDNATFYKYYCNGHNYLDEYYFLRNKQDYNLDIESYCFQNDTLFATSHDYKVAQILANSQLQEFLIRRVKTLTDTKVNTRTKVLKWTGPKVGLIELIYALHITGVFNHGAIDIRDIAKGLGIAFDIEVGQFHRTFHEICNRKSDRAKFLSTLKESLINRMDQSDAL